MVGGRRAECPIACNDAHAAAKDGCEEGACANGELMCPDNPLGEPPPTINQKIFYENKICLGQ